MDEKTWKRECTRSHRHNSFVRKPRGKISAKITDDTSHSKNVPNNLLKLDEIVHGLCIENIH
jgi:hypothetical protein